MKTEHRTVARKSSVACWHNKATCTMCTWPFVHVITVDLDLVVE